MFTYHAPVTPAEISPKLQELIDELVPGSEPIYVEVNPLEGAPMNECFLIVEEQISAHGGKSRVGWTLWELPGLFVEAEFHAVWENEKGDLIDITPKSSPTKNILFLEEPGAKFQNTQRNNVKKPLINDLALSAYLKTFTERHELLNRGERAGQFGEIELVGAEAEENNNIMMRQAESFMQLTHKFKKAGPYLPCPCGSGKKLKWCHKREYLNCENHPIKGKVSKFSTPPRKRYVEDWEVAEALKIASPFITAYIRLKLLTGLRRGDLLSLKVSDLQDDGIHITPRKTAHSTGKSMIIEWSDDLKFAVDQIMKLRKKILSLWVFHTNLGQPYIKENGTANGFDSIWQRFMKKALAKTSLAIRFTEHDLRAKVASEIEIEHAKILLGHSDSRTTERIYRRKVALAKPSR